MPSSAAPSPLRRDGKSYFDTSPERPSPNKILRLQQLFMDKEILPPRRLSSPAKNHLQVRPRLNQYFTLDHAVALIKSSKNILVLTGAGISTSLGVPDFRSASGVYSILADSIYTDPQELFHIDNFKTNPQEFYKQAAKAFPRMLGLVPSNGELPARSLDKSGNQLPSVPRYSLTHAFISLLEGKGKLLTNYTQNIDNLESAAGISKSKLLQCHGTLATASCMSCGKQKSAAKYMPYVLRGQVPFCSCSSEASASRPEHNRQRGRAGKKKRKWDDYEESESDDSDFPKGLFKPDMTFFGEEVADTYAGRLEQDKMKVDLLIIIGTALKVEPVNEMLLNIPPNVPQIWISRDRCQREGVKVDIELLGECDVILEEIARKAGWENHLAKRLWTLDKSLRTERETAQGREQSLNRAASPSRKGSVPPLKKPSLDRVRSSSKPESGSTLLAEATDARRIRSASERRDHSDPPTKPPEKRTGTIVKDMSEEVQVVHSPTKPGRPLQIRHKSNESQNLTLKSIAPIIIKVNDEEINPRETPGIKQSPPATEVPASTKFETAHINDIPVKDVPVVHAGRSAEPDEAGPRTTDKPPALSEGQPNGVAQITVEVVPEVTRVKPRSRTKSASKVVIEQELGTNHRWFIRRVKDSS